MLSQVALVAASGLQKRKSKGESQDHFVVFIS